MGRNRMRPDHINCVAYIRPERRTWCGVDQGIPPFFMDICHAAIHGEAKGRF